MSPIWTAVVIVAGVIVAGLIVLYMIGYVIIKRERARAKAESDQRIEHAKQREARLLTFEIWLKLSIEELKKIANGESFTADLPPCPICRGWVARSETIDDPTKVGIIFHPCGCTFTLDDDSGKIQTVGPGGETL